jgi:TP901 family phage tail tape measure protein
MGATNYTASTIFRGTDKTTPVMNSMARNALKANQKIQGSFAKVGKAVGSGFLNVGKYAVTGAVAAAGFAAKNAVTDFLDFESEMLNVRAVSGATEAQYDSMTTAALRMAKGSVFTSMQVAQGMKYLGQAGWETNKIIGAMPGILQLAAATQSDLAMSSDMLVNTMTVFKMKAEESTHAADVFTGAASASTLEIEDLKESMKDAAPAAADFNITLEETSAILAQMANNGIKGSRAGTAFRSMTMRLASPTKDAQKWLKKLGVEVTDEAGNFNNIIDIMDQMRAGLSGLTEKQQSMAKAAIFGKLSISGVNAVLSDQDGSVRKLTKSFKENINVASGMAEIQLSGASGAMKGLTSAWDAFSIAAVQKYAPALQGLAEHLTTLISGELGATGKTIQDTNIKNMEMGIGGQNLQSPFPTWSDQKFQNRYDKFKSLRKGGFSEQEAIKKYSSSFGKPDMEMDLFKQLYYSETVAPAKAALNKETPDQRRNTGAVRSLYGLDAKLKSEDSQSPFKALMEKIVKSENTLIIKAPKGTTEFIGKIPSNLKLVETF